MKKIVLIIAILVSSNAAILDDYLNKLKIEAKKENPNFKEFSYQKGKEIFYSTHIGKRGKKVSCASCHTKDLTSSGENIFTGKILEPLSPKANPKRLTKLKKIKKWLRRNFKDVYKREGSAIEKGNVLVFIRDFK